MLRGKEFWVDLFYFISFDFVLQVRRWHEQRQGCAGERHSGAGLGSGAQVRPEGQHHLRRCERRFDFVIARNELYEKLCHTLGENDEEPQARNFRALGTTLIRHKARSGQGLKIL